MSWRISPLIAAAAICLGCQQDSEAGPPIIRTHRDYAETSNRVADLATDLIVLSAQGTKLTDDQVARLREAKRLAEGLIGFDPKSFPGYYLLAKLHRALGERKEADTNYLLAFQRIPTKDISVDGLAAAADLYYDYATFLFEDGQYQDAHAYAVQAVQMAPENADYLATAASVKIELRKTAEAKDLVDKALKINSRQGLALRLRRLLEMSSTPSRPADASS